MSALLTKSAGILMSLALTVAPCLAQSDAADKLDQQVKSDASTLTAEQQQLADYQQQAKWYDDFAVKRLQHADIERTEVQNRLKIVQANLAKRPDKNPKSPANQELASLTGWLKEEASKRSQIEATREKWKAAIEGTQSKISQTKYQKDVDTASLQHQQEQDKENAARSAENPKPAPPQIKQNTILLPGFEAEQGTIPEMLGPRPN